LSGSLRCNQLNLLIVNAATGTLPTASAHSAAPPGNCFISHPASGAVSVSFHNLAGRITSRSASSTTIPCCWPATLIASTRGEPALAHAASKAAHHAEGSCSERGGVVAGCGDEPRA
jgi:hypothetical protein